MPAVHELWYCVKALSMKVCRYPITSIMMSMNKKVLIFDWRKLIQDQHSWAADEVGICAHEWLL